ncbi:FliM/FliN family flagellar motor switch protein [Pseudooceanicola sp. C21-150M6]|uniref:FliM/FliN family flagellar motor switch protein n=1 Tax=Pseudooceanicola sp. C21-150M6 TaxID=3434355 RepID=UPI003D7F690D
MSPAKALRLAFARTADALWDMPLVVSGLEQTEVSADDLIASLEEDGLLMLLDGPDGAIGGARVDHAILSGVIEAQTMGAVSTFSPEKRQPTRTDAAMVAPLIDGAMERLEVLLGEEPEAAWINGFRFGSMMESPRMLSLAIKAPSFHMLRFTLDLAGRRDGEAMLILPVAEEVSQRPQNGDPNTRLQSQVMQAPAELEAILHRVKMSLAGVSRLQPGDEIPVPRTAITRMFLETASSHRVAEATLGQLRGMRAVRLKLPDGARAEAQAGGAGAAAGSGALAAEGVSDAVSLQDGEDRAGPGGQATAITPVSVQSEAPEPAEPAASDFDRDGELDLLGDLPSLGDLPGMSDLPTLAPDEGDDDGMATPLSGLPAIE